MPDAATLSVWPPSASLSVPSEIVRTSFVTDPSTSVALIVTVPDELLMLAMPEACSVNEPPPFESVFV